MTTWTLSLYILMLCLQLTIGISELMQERSWPKALYWFAAVLITIAVLKMK